MNHFVNFERHEFLIFFDHETFLEEEAGIVQYGFYDENKMFFSLYISTYDLYAIITLKHETTEKYIFEIGLKNICRITCDKQNLYFYRNTNDRFPSEDIKLVEPFFVVQVKPTTAISIGL